MRGLLTFGPALRRGDVDGGQQGLGGLRQLGHRTHAGRIGQLRGIAARGERENHGRQRGERSRSCGVAAL